MSSEWIELKDKKSFSRLLYTNPVCFLTTLCDNQDDNSLQRNVMVVSWLTPTNNDGRFMMSINKNRHTSRILLSSSKQEFVLSVPIAGMEILVLNVGKTSGRYGRSKFPQDHHDKHIEANNIVSTGKKRKGHEFANGIDGLIGVKIGTSNDEISHSERNRNVSFAIKGTVAHLKCAIYAIPSIEKENLIDDEHNLILADIHEAYVHSNYWDDSKKQFFPQQRSNQSNENDPPSSSIPPYLTFFGSQKFGYVSTSP